MSKSKKAANKSVKKSAKVKGKAKGKGAKNERSLLDAAAEVLQGGPASASEIIARIREQRLWSTSAKTPQNTLSSGIRAEIKKKGSESRFRLADKGVFALA